MAEMLAVIKQGGPPTKNTPGAVGQYYIDIDTGLRWECVEATSEKLYKQNKVVYNWEPRGLDPDFVVDSLPSGNTLLLASVPTVLPVKGNWSSVFYGGGKFVVVTTNSSIAAYSTDGINWTLTTLPVKALWRSVCYGNGKFVAVTNGDIAAYSTNGINWTQTTLPVSAQWYSVCYGDGKFVAAVNNSSIAAYSTDGINWTQTTLPVSAKWQTVCYGDGKFVVVTNGDIAAYSTDGINWTQTTLPPDIVLWRSVCYGDGKFVAVAINTRSVAYSTDGIDWIQATIPTVECLSGKNAVDDLKKALGLNAPIIPSSTAGSTKKFKIAVDDTGALTATEVTA